jgi:hypothetical protein
MSGSGTHTFQDLDSTSSHYVAYGMMDGYDAYDWFSEGDVGNVLVQYGYAQSLADLDKIDLPLTTWFPGGASYTECFSRFQDYEQYPFSFEFPDWRPPGWRVWRLTYIRSWEIGTRDWYTTQIWVVMRMKWTYSISVEDVGHMGCIPYGNEAYVAVMPHTVSTPLSANNDPWSGDMAWRQRPGLAVGSGGNRLASAWHVFRLENSHFANNIYLDPVDERGWHSIPAIHSVALDATSFFLNLPELKSCYDQAKNWEFNWLNDHYPLPIPSQNFCDFPFQLPVYRDFTVGIADLISDDGSGDPFRVMANPLFQMWFPVDGVDRVPQEKFDAYLNSYGTLTMYPQTYPNASKKIRKRGKDTNLKKT